MSDTPPAGWYPDPQDADRQRYWDGTAWTEHTADASSHSSGATAAAGAATTTSGSPDTWTWQSIVATIFCCNILGVIGVLNAGRAEQAVKAGDLRAANQYASSAKKWTLWSAGIAIVLFGLYFAFIAVVAGTSGFTEFQNF